MPAIFPLSEAPSNPHQAHRPQRKMACLTRVWLKSSADTDLPLPVKILEQNADQIGMGQIFYGSSLKINFNDPTRDPRTPDIITGPQRRRGLHRQFEEAGRARWLQTMTVTPMCMLQRFPTATSSP